MKDGTSCGSRNTHRVEKSILVAAGRLHRLIATHRALLRIQVVAPGRITELIRSLSYAPLDLAVVGQIQVVCCARPLGSIVNVRAPPATVGIVVDQRAEGRGLVQCNEGCHVFESHLLPRRVFVMNANRSPVERTLGVDMLYYNELRNSFVLVQYKKMRPETVRGGKKSLFYGPDDQLWVEIERMRRVDQLCGAAEGEYRLNWSASWVKLCDPNPAIEDPTALIKGMYALDHLEELLATQRGPRNGIRIGYDDVDRYFSNTMFLDLVRDGWIGSRGTASETLKSLVQESPESGRAIMLGLEPRSTPQT